MERSLESAEVNKIATFAHVMAIRTSSGAGTEPIIIGWVGKAADGPDAIDVIWHRETPARYTARNDNEQVLEHLSQRLLNVRDKFPDFHKGPRAKAQAAAAKLHTPRTESNFGTF